MVPMTKDVLCLAGVVDNDNTTGLKNREDELSNWRTETLCDSEHALCGFLGHATVRLNLRQVAEDTIERGLDIGNTGEWLRVHETAKEVAEDPVGRDGAYQDGTPKHSGRFFFWGGECQKGMNDTQGGKEEGKKEEREKEEREKQKKREQDPLRTKL